MMLGCEMFKDDEQSTGAASTSVKTTSDSNTSTFISKESQIATGLLKKGAQIFNVLPQSYLSSLTAQTTALSKEAELESNYAASVITFCQGLAANNVSFPIQDIDGCNITCTSNSMALTCTNGDSMQFSCEHDYLIDFIGANSSTITFDFSGINWSSKTGNVAISMNLSAQVSGGDFNNNQISLQAVAAMDINDEDLVPNCDSFSSFNLEIDGQANNNCAELLNNAGDVRTCAGQ